MSLGFIHCALYAVLGIAAYIDHCTYRIPNEIILILVALAGIHVLMGEGIHPFSSLCLSIFLSFLAPITSCILRRPIDFGWGDVKLMGACALFIPIDHIGGFVMGVGLFSLFYRLVFQKNPIPFAPAIAASFFIATT